MLFPNGLEADLSFEAQTGRLASVAHAPTSTGNPVLKFDHAYDIRGNLSALSELAGTKTFTYDKVERLTGAAWASPLQQIESYSYDAEGNRIASHISAGYSTDDADRVVEDADNVYTWSPDGQLTRRQPKAAGATAWDFVSSFQARTNQMRLDSVSGSDGRRVDFYYDPFQRLVAHHWPSPRGNDELYYDGPDVVLELRHLSGGDQWVRYVHGPQDDQPLATELYAQGAQPTPGTGAQYYYHADGEGSIRMLSDAVGVVANRYDYDSFGRRLAVVESLPLQPYGWKGREWVPGPDIYYNRARFYDPVLGRFLAQDPLGYGGGNINLYSFAWNNPKNWSDPSGLSATAYSGLIGLAPVDQYRRIACNLNTIFAKVALGLDRYTDLKSDGTACGATGTPAHYTDLADNPPDIGDPGNCNDQEKKAISDWYKAVCLPADDKSCNGNFTREENLKIMKLNADCGAARDSDTKQCWPASAGDQGHIDRINKHRNRI